MSTTEIPEATRGLLLLDIDGVLNPHPKRAKRPPGYETERLPYFHPEKRRRTQLTIWFNRSHGPTLLGLAARTRLTLAWCSQGWTPEEANEKIGRWIGLPPLPGVRFGPPEEFGFQHWKFGQVADYVADRPFAWLDDDFRHTDKQRRAEFETRYAGQGLLVQVDAYHGLLGQHLDQVERWADTLSRSTGARPPTVS